MSLYRSLWTTVGLMLCISLFSVGCKKDSKPESKGTDTAGSNSTDNPAGTGAMDAGTDPGSEPETPLTDGELDPESGLPETDPGETESDPAAETSGIGSDSTPDSLPPTEAEPDPDTSATPDSANSTPDTPGPPIDAKVGFEIGNLAPEIQGEDLDGVKFKLSDYRGKVVVLDFWGNW